MKRFFLRLLRRFRSHKLDWLELTPEQRRLFLAIKKKHDRYQRLEISKHDAACDCGVMISDLLKNNADLIAALAAMVDHFGVLEDNPMLHPAAIAATKKARAALAKAEAK